MRVANRLAHTPVLCITCHGASKWKNEKFWKDGTAVCDDCASTGREPIPLAELYKDEREGRWQ